MSDYRVLFPDGDRTYVTAGSPREAIGMVVDGRHSYTRSADNFVESLPANDRYSDEQTDMCQTLIRDLADKIEAGWHV